MAANRKSRIACADVDEHQDRDGEEAEPAQADEDHMPERWAMFEIHIIK